MDNVKNKMTCEKLNEIMVECFPGVGFAISDSYDGETAYDKMTMADGHEKPAWDDIETKAREANLID